MRNGLWQMALVLAVAGFPVGLAAHDHGPYAHISKELRDWVKALTDKEGNGCCDTADGYPAEVEWDTEANGYKVRIEGVWHAVPPNAVIEKPNRMGHAMVWYWRKWENGISTPQIRCFIAGAGT